MTIALGGTFLGQQLGSMIAVPLVALFFIVVTFKGVVAFSQVGSKGQDIHPVISALLIAAVATAFDMIYLYFLSGGQIQFDYTPWLLAIIGGLLAQRRIQGKHLLFGLG
ncbi:MAG: hypothetical protein M1142_04295 [Patescibacteria group bacterium]|nr:hypothetical protein [Patescibacteria group bacterium]